MSCAWANLWADRHSQGGVGYLPVKSTHLRQRSARLQQPCGVAKNSRLSRSFYRLMEMDSVRDHMTVTVSRIQCPG